MHSAHTVAELALPPRISEIAAWQIQTIAQPRGTGQIFRPVTLTIYAPSKFTALLLAYKQLKALNLTHGGLTASAA